MSLPHERGLAEVLKGTPEGAVPNQIFVRDTS